MSPLTGTLSSMLRMILMSHCFSHGTKYLKIFILPNYSYHSYINAKINAGMAFNIEKILGKMESLEQIVPFLPDGIGRISFRLKIRLEVSTIFHP